MAVTFTKKLTMTWTGTPTYPTQQPLDETITAEFQRQVTAGTTDGLIDIVDDQTRSRVFADQESAEAWMNVLQTAATKAGRIITFSITDI